MTITYPAARSAWRAGLLAASLLALASCATGPPPIARHYETLIQPSATPSACRVDNPVEVAAATIPFSRPVEASCRFIAEFDRFEQEALRPLARRYFSEDLKTIIHYGAYTCRTTRAGRESEHARGLAMDVAGFELADGREVLVKDAWSRRDREGRFLRAVAQAACRYFNEVLTPDSDSDHANHFHLDLGPYRLCVRR